MAPLGILPKILNGTATHRQGGHLDQVLSNQDLLIDQLPLSTQSDHTAMLISFSFLKNSQDVDLKNLPTVITQWQLRMECLSE